MRRNNPPKQITLTYEDGSTRTLQNPAAAMEQHASRELFLDLIQAVIDQGSIGTWLTLQQLTECAEARHRHDMQEQVEETDLTPTPDHHYGVPIVGGMMIDDRTLEVGLRPFNAAFTQEQHELPEDRQWRIVVDDLLRNGLPLMMYRGDLGESFHSGRMAALHVIFGRLCYQDGRTVPMPHPEHGYNVVAILTDEFQRLYPHN